MKQELDDLHTNQEILARIQALRQELDDLRKIVVQMQQTVVQMQQGQRKAYLKGLWKGVEISEQEIGDAKRSVFRDAEQWEE